MSASSAIDSVVCLNCSAISHRVGSKDGFDLLACTCCDLRFVYPPPTQSQITEYYDGAYFEWHHGVKRMEGDIAAAALRLAFLEVLIAKGSVLDVGCGNGVFVMSAAERGWRVGIVELNKDMLDQSRPNCTMGAWHDIEEATGHFDALTMWEYIEHVVDPRFHIEQARRLLSDGGILALSTPNLRAVHGRKAFLDWELTKPPEHLTYWNDENLISFVERSGFTLVGLRYHGLAFPLAAWRVLGRRSNKRTLLWPISSLIWSVMRRWWIGPILKGPDWRGEIYEGVELYFRRSQ